jgi:hypothetical protein
MGVPAAWPRHYKAIGFPTPVPPVFIVAAPSMYRTLVDVTPYSMEEIGHLLGNSFPFHPGVPLLPRERWHASSNAKV